MKKKILIFCLLAIPVMGQYSVRDLWNKIVLNSALTVQTGSVHTLMNSVYSSSDDALRFRMVGGTLQLFNDADTLDIDMSTAALFMNFLDEGVSVWSIDSTGGQSTSQQITSTLAIGTSPFAVTSTTVNTNLNADFLDGSHASAFMPAALAKDLVTTAPITGGEDNILPGADSDVTLALTVEKDLVTTSPLTGGTDDILTGSDSDITIALTVEKDLVTTAPLTGGTDDILTGSDADITIAMPVATTSADGYLSQTDWDTFNDKRDQLTPVTTVSTATYDILVTDNVLHVTRTATGTCAIDLKTAQMVSGRRILIKDAGAGATTYNITISTEGAEKIDGADTAVINVNYGAAWVYSNGSHWFVY